MCSRLSRCVQMKVAEGVMNKLNEVFLSMYKAGCRDKVKHVGRSDE